MAKSIVILATMDTKNDEANYLKELITKEGHKVILFDIGSGAPPKLVADITADKVARAGGANIDDVRKSKDRRWITSVMINGAVAISKQLIARGQMDGVIGLGGMSSALLASSIMAEMPMGIPKLILTSGASMPGSNKYFGPTGITVMHSMFDSGGLNTLLKEQLVQAARAICGMVEENITSGKQTSKKPMVAMSTYGYTEATARYISDALESKYEIIRFHATGIPEITMEKLMEEGVFKGVIDLVPSTVTNGEFGGSRVSWPRRLEVAGECGLPQVILPTGLNTLSKIGITEDKLPPDLKQRKYYYMDAERVTVWLNEAEVIKIASVYARKLNKAKGPTIFIFPMRSWHPIEKEGSEYCNPKIYRLFIDQLKKELKADVEVREIDAAIETKDCAMRIVEAFEEVMSKAARAKK